MEVNNNFYEYVCQILTCFKDIYCAGNFLQCHEGCTNVICRVRGVVLTDGKHKLKVDRLIPHSNLPNCKPNDRWHTRGNGQELWLVDGDPALVDPVSIVSRSSIWLCDLPKPPRYNYYVTEILYRFEGRWKYREISKQQLLPSEGVTIQSPPRPMPTMKVFLDMYIDDFGTFRNVYHSLGGVYLQLGNMPLTYRKRLKNHFLIGFIPFGAKLVDFIKPVIEDIKHLERGIVMKTIHGEAWVIGGLGCVTADLPQGNDIAGIKHHNANQSCRACNASIEDLTDQSYDYFGNAHETINCHD